MYYMNYFFIFSILGHILESFVYSDGKSGILLGWWTPIYGVGVVIILLLNKFIFEKLKVNKILKAFLIFIIGSLSLSIIEVIGGHLIEWIFHTTFWDYSYLKFHIGKYIALEMACIWGLGSILIIYFLKPFCDKIIRKIPKFFPYILSIVFILDLFLTIIIKH